MAGNRRSRSEKKPATKRLNAQLRDESLKRLMLHVVMMGKNPGDIISDLIDNGLKEWAMPARNTARVKSTDRLVLPDEVSQPTPTLV